jgi:integrase/recombinase XerD
LISLAQVLRGLRKAGLRKNAHLHTLRHSYATHLHEQGTDILVIKRLLGHKSLKTTEIYTHLSKKTLHGVKNPIDQLLA